MFIGQTDRDFFGLAVLVYGLSTVHTIFLWRKGFRRDDHIAYLLLLVGAGFHTIAMLKRGFSLSRCPLNTLYEATIFFEWTIATACLATGLWSRLRFLGAFSSPVLFSVGVFALMPGLDSTGLAVSGLTGWSRLHAALSLLSYGAFGLGAVAAVMYLTQEHDLRYRKARAVLSWMPPLERLERAVRVLLIGGFCLLTVGLVVGAGNLKRRYGVFFKSDPKILWSMLVWGVYLGLVILNTRFHERGRRFAWGIIVCFVFVLLTFWGVNLLSPIHQ